MWFFEKTNNIGRPSVELPKRKKESKTQRQWKDYNRYQRNSEHYKGILETSTPVNQKI